MKINKVLLGFIILICQIGNHNADASRLLTNNPSKNQNPPVHTIELLSKPYTIDKVYKSMEGPSSIKTVKLWESETPELLWITGYRVEVVGEDGKTPSKPEFLCHNNLDVDFFKHREMFPNTRFPSERIFTLSQGQFSIQFPEGFGLPVLSNEEFRFSSQVLNHNIKDETFRVRHRVYIDIIRDKDLKTPFKALFPANGFVMALLEGDDGVYGVEEPNALLLHASCLPGEHAKSAGLTSIYDDGFGKKFSGHWVVKPGREERRTLVTEKLKIPYDTTLHYVALHLHPFAETLELRDLTADKTVFKSIIQGPKKGVGISYVEDFSSREGIPMYKDHDYELVSIYNNTSGVDQDAMATMFMYLHDKNFEKPNIEKLHKMALQKEIEIRKQHEASTGSQRRVEDVPVLKNDIESLKLSQEQVVLHTDLGDVRIVFFPGVAPSHVAQILKLMKLGVYDSNHFIRVEPNFIIQVGSKNDRSAGPLSVRQLDAITSIPAEFSNLRHVRGVLSMARETNDPDSAETSFSILLDDAPHLDGKYTIFGQVVSGFNVIDKIVKMPRDKNKMPYERIEIINTEIIMNEQTQ